MRERRKCNTNSHSTTLPSSQQFLNDIASHIGEPKVTALVTERQFLVVQAQAMKDSCMQIVDVDLILNNRQTQIVRLANHLPSLNTSSSHPDAERERVMISSFSSLRGAAVFHQRRAAEFPSPYHQSTVKQSTLLQVFN